MHRTTHDIVRGHKRRRAQAHPKLLLLPLIAFVITPLLTRAPQPLPRLAPMRLHHRAHGGHPAVDEREHEEPDARAGEGAAGLRDPAVEPERVGERRKVEHGVHRARGERHPIIHTHAGRRGGRLMFVIQVATKDELHSILCAVGEQGECEEREGEGEHRHRGGHLCGGGAE